MNNQYKNHESHRNNGNRNNNGYFGNNRIEIKTPYSFVPISDKVFFPNWSDFISYDVPFTNEISGKIEFNILVESPMTVLSGETDKDGRYLACKTAVGEYYIPATSIKGEIRNVLNIMSFGKIKNVIKEIKKGKRNPTMLAKTEDAIPNTHLDPRPDLSDCIFGFTSDNRSLKGRVHFGHAFIVNEARYEFKSDIYLVEPHATYYPFYVEGGKEWSRKDKTISGFKRYPVRVSGNTYDNKGKDSRTIQVFNKGTIFHETVYFHNLKEEELGALLSAISFHNNHDKYFHSLGYGKPLGFGKVKIADLSVVCPETKELKPKDYMARYEILMEQFSKDNQIGTWLKAKQVQELFLMAKGVPSDKEYLFSYMPLNHFNKLKKLSEKERALPHFSKRIDEKNVEIKSLIKNENVY